MRQRLLVRTVAAASLLALAAVGGMTSVDQAAAADEGRLSLFKRIENLDTGASFGDRSAWDVQAVNVDTGETIRGQALNGVQSVLVAPGDYVISEIATASTPSGYRFVSWDCGDAGQFAIEAPTITVPANGTVVCTVRNDAMESNLTLLKEVEGGSASPGDWMLHAEGLEGQGNLDGASGVNALVRIGRWRLSETDGPSNYTLDEWTCVDEISGNEVPIEADDVIDIGLNQNVFCTAHNSTALPPPPRLSLVKEVTGPPGATLADLTDWDLTASGPTTITGATGSTEVTNAGVSAGTYALSEAGGPEGYAPGGWFCTDRTGGSDLDTTGDQVTIGEDMDVRCVVTNDFAGGFLTLVKTVDGAAPPRLWELSATGTGPITTAISGRSGMPGVTDVAVPAGSYDLAESGPTAGYVTEGWSCTNSTGFVDSVDVGVGESVTCTIENDAVQPHLTLVKEVDNGVGGPLEPADWTLSATGPTAVSGTTGSPDVTFVAVTPGDYTLGESSTDPSAPDYAAGPWSCEFDDTGEPVGSGGTVTVPAGDRAITCTVTNSWTGSLLSLRKVVIAPLGGGDPASAWTLTATSGGTVHSGTNESPEVTRVPVPGGSSWTLSESGPAGYDSLGWLCAGGSQSGDVVTAVPGQHVVCTVTNAAVSPRLTLQKELLPGAGSTAVVEDFWLNARGPGNAAFGGLTRSESVTNAFAPPGPYVFSEIGPDGFDVTWDCVDRTGAALDFAADAEELQLAYGDDAVCTATNTPRPPTLSLTKFVVGGPGTALDWELSATDSLGATISGSGSVPRTEVAAGMVELAEVRSGGEGDYVAGNWLCSGDGFGVVAPAGPTASFRLPLGVDATCTMTNVFEPPILTLRKEVVGGPLSADDFTLAWTDTADPTHVDSGVTGDPAVTNVQIGSGSYELSEESDAPEAVDYTASDWTCVGGDFTPPDVIGLTVPDISSVCTVTNTYDPPRLTLVKDVVDGPLSAADWELSWTDADDASHTGSGATGGADVTVVAVGSGTYELAEASTDDAADDYAPGEWACDGGTLAGDQVSLEAGEDVTCTIVNVWTPSVDPPPSEPPTDPPTGPPATDPPATGDEGVESSDPGTPLPGAGVGGWTWPLAGLGLLAVVLGVVLLVVRRRGGGPGVS